jgi:porin
MRLQRNLCLARDGLPIWALLLTLALHAGAANADVEDESDPTRGRSGYESDEVVGGPSSTSEQLQEDDRIVDPVLRLQWLDETMAPYFDFKRQLNERYGLAFGADYSIVLQGASKSAGSDEATSGMFRFFGSWDFLGRESGNTATLVYKIENRHDLGTSTAAQDLGFELGYAGITAAAFGDYRNEGWGLTNLFWRQRLGEGRVTTVAGIVDATDYVDIYGLVSPWLHFTNLAFSTNPAIPAPNQGVGAAVGVRATDQIYVIAGVADANGDPVDPLGSIDTFFDDNEYFKHLELGFSSSVRERLFLDNVHVTLWHIDERSDTGVPDGWGVAISAAWFFEDRWMPFVRAGYADDGGALYEGSVSWGVGYYVADRRDVFGVGLNWSRPSDTAVAPGLDDQYTAELFYRIQLSQSLAITPDIQLIIDPGLNPDEDSIFVAGLRVRLAL